MRVIAGEFRSRVLKSLPGLDVRPTPDRLREALFSAIAPRVDGAVFADLYAGTGSVGIEALSRGALRAIFVERSRAAVIVIRQNLASLGIENRADVRQGKAASLDTDADIVFLDPPYHLDVEYETSMARLAGKPPALVLVQHDTHRKLQDAYGPLRRTRTMKHGDNCVSFYEATSDATGSPS